jgi:hypothetical protein
MVQRIKFMVRQFLREPLWFKLLISSTLLVSILFSSSFFSDHIYYQSAAKLAAAIFFTSYGIKFRRNTKISIIFFAVAILSIYMSWDSLNQD